MGKRDPRRVDVPASDFTQYLHDNRESELGVMTRAVGGQSEEIHFEGDAGHGPHQFEAGGFIGDTMISRRIVSASSIFFPPETT